MEKRFCTPLSSGTLPAISSSDTLQDCERSLSLEELLPGIQNHITLENIASQLSWKDFHVLSSVSRGWNRAIRNRQVYDVRVRLQTTETLALIFEECDGVSFKISLYSARDRSCYRLPLNLPFSQCVSVDGKVYALGGRESHCRQLHVLDVAGQRQWRLCASMMEPRSSLKCGVINGKIFAFGRGGSGRNQSWGAEVYDPKEDTWSPIKTMPIETMSKIFNHQVHTVEALGQELFHCGYTCQEDHTDSGRPEFAVYHSVKDEWGDFKHFERENELPFVAQGRLHSMSKAGIYVHDVESHSRRQLHTFPPGGMEYIDMDENVMFPIYAKAVEDELLVLMDWCEVVRDYASPGPFLIHTKGFGGDKIEIQWEKVPINVTRTRDSSNRCSISLLEL